MNYQIVPLEGFNKTATNVDINVIEYQFGITLKIYYSVNSDEGRIYDGNIIYNKEIIDNWGIDDEYIINLIFKSIGVDRIVI